MICERTIELLKDDVLIFDVEVDQQVAAEHPIEVAEDAFRRNAVFFIQHVVSRKSDPFLDSGNQLQLEEAPFRRKIFRQDPVGDQFKGQLCR